MYCGSRVLAPSNSIPDCGSTTPQDYPEWSGFGRRRERECGSSTAAAAGSIRRLHPNSTRRKGTVRCAIYTRKSSEEGLEQEFNSLQAQREACEAFITSQRHEGWVCLPKAYNDGGFSGATIDRPALQQLLADLSARRVDIVVVYKIDRLTRSLADFAKIVEILDARGASLRFGDAAVQHDDLDGALDPECSVVLCAVRARGHRRTHSRQDRRLEKKRDVDGWRPTARLSGAKRQAHHRRRRGGNRPLHFSPLCRARLGAVVKGRTGSPEHPEQVADERLGPHIGWQAIGPRCALPDIAEP